MNISRNLPVARIDPAFLEAARNVYLSDEFNCQTRGRFQNTSSKTVRHTVNYGYSYDGLKKGQRDFTPFPPIIAAICASAVQNLEPVLGRKLPAADKYTNCIVSLYNKGGLLQPHIDTDASFAKSSFRFGEDILNVILEADRTGRFYVQKGEEGKRPEFDPYLATLVPEEAGSAFLLTEDLRHAPYYHGVSPVSDKRISITYRTVEFK